MERCPCCKARLGGSTLCPRCQADLANVIEAEQSARFWLAEAIHYWQENKIEQSLNASELSLRLKKTKLALVFRDFLIRQQCRDILDLLTQKQLLPAKQRLYSMRRLFPHYKLLQELHSFIDYLWAKHQDTPNLYSTSTSAVNEETGELSNSSEAN